MRLRSALLVLPVSLFALACAPEDEPNDNADDPGTSATPEPSGSASETSEPDACAKESLGVLNAGTLTIGTDSPAYEPWFADDDPTNGKGYESAFAYALAEELGFTADEVTWVTVPFNSSYKPGAKEFDFDINQISITPERSAVVDFSDGYYDGTQAVVALKGTPVAEATSVAELADYNLGAQTGTTSLTAIRDFIQPANDPAVFEDTNAAKQALLNGQVDGIIADLPTAKYISDFEIKGSVVVGQFTNTDAGPDQFGLLFEKGNPLVTCVNTALAALEAAGTVADLQAQWLADYQAVPVLQ